MKFHTLELLIQSYPLVWGSSRIEQRRAYGPMKSSSENRVGGFGGWSQSNLRRCSTDCSTETSMKTNLLFGATFGWKNELSTTTRKEVIAK